MNAQNTTVEQRTMAASAWVEIRPLCRRGTRVVVAWLVEAVSRYGGAEEEWSRAMINCGTGTSAVRAVGVLRTVDQQYIV